jgi:hypothetical protein
VPKPQRIKLGNGKHSHAALRATNTADQPIAAALRDLSQRRIYDLHQLLVFVWEPRQRHSQA